MSVEISATPDGARIAVKVVPNANRDEIAGPLGTHLKIRVTAPAEGGRANAAACRLLARKLGIRSDLVSIESGSTTPRKLLQIRGLDPEAVRHALGLDQ